MQLLRQLEVSARDEPEAIEHASATSISGFLDPLGDFDFLLAGQQRHLAHLLEIHPDRIVEDVELRFRLFFFLFVVIFLAVLVTIDFRRIDDVDLHARRRVMIDVQLVRVGQVPAATPR